MAAIAALISSRWASKGGVYSPSNVIFTAVCVVIIVLNRMAVGYRSPLLECLFWKVKQRLHVWFQTKRQLAMWLVKLHDFNAPLNSLLVELRSTVYTRSRNPVLNNFKFR